MVGSREGNQLNPCSSGYSFFIKDNYSSHFISSNFFSYTEKYAVHNHFLTHYRESKIKWNLIKKRIAVLTDKDSITSWQSCMHTEFIFQRRRELCVTASSTEPGLSFLHKASGTFQATEACSI